jgi:hypothetical protein
MARQNVDIGVQGNDGTGDSIRESFRKVNENFVQLFSIFGAGDTISFKDLDDTPETYGSDQVIVANAEGDSLVAKNLVGGEGISVDHTDENEIRIISTGGKVGNDIRPNLGGHLNAQNFTIGNLAEPTDETAVLFNALHSTSLTADDLVINKGYADQRYLQASGGPGTGSQIRIRDEPLDDSEYTLIIDLWVNGYASIPDHGFNSGSNGISYVYTITGTTPATGLTIGTTYYLRYVTKDRMGVYSTRDNAIDDIARIIVNDPDVPAINRGTERFTDAMYMTEDEDGFELDGFWVSNEALPRKSVVRRQGDHMSGALYLHDHPGEFAGQGSPNGPDDLQAATKFYVDSSSFASQSNLFVATSGTDDQDNVPLEKQGRAFAYAFATVNKACQRAEDLINQSLSEPGPYRQQLTYGNNTNFAYLDSFSTGSGVRRTLNVYTNGGGVDQSKNANNRDLREGSIIKGLRSGATGRVITYTAPVSLTDSYLIELLHTIDDVTYFQSDYKNASQKLEDNRAFIATEVVEYIKDKYPSLVFDETKCSRDAGLIVDALAFDTRYGGNTKTIKAARAYFNGAVSVLPSGQVSQTIDGINYINLLAQQIITNTTIPAATTSTGFGFRNAPSTQNSSGEAGEPAAGTLITRLINSVKNIVQYGLSGNSTALEFLEDEPLEFGQPVPELQITIRVESGIYYEQMPIRVPTNVSIKGDEFRRSIIRPAPGISTSPWAAMYFYRDDTFDGMTRTYTSASGAASSFVPANTDFVGSPAYYKVTVTSTTGLETGMYLYVTAGTGAFSPATTVTRIISTTEFEISHEPSVTLSGATVRGLNSSGLAPTNTNFGYHYLTDPSGVSGIFNDSILKSSGRTNAANLLANNKTFIQAETILYINAKYGAGFAASYNQTLCARDVGYIVDALVYDITNGGTTRTIAAAQAYRRNASALIAITTQLTETLDGIDYINSLVQLILPKTIIGAPSVPTGSGATVGKRNTSGTVGGISTPIAQNTSGGTSEVGANIQVADLINGIINTIVGVNNPPKQNKDMDVFLLNDGTILRNITAQGHGGFMCVLDPEGQIQTKSPYFQTLTSLSGSVNKKSFRGGMFIDGFSGNLPARIIGKNSNTELLLDGLIVRAPQVPNSFYINGARYQINAVENYNRSTGTCTVLLDIATPYSTAYTVPVSITIETAGNRSMLSNDFTQVNDLGYGLVCTNNGIAEAVSVFTYYNWTSYYSLNGGQIRSLNGSSCNGEYGLRAAGSDPNEVPDPVVLGDTMVQNVRVYSEGSFASKNLAEEVSVYIDYYTYAGLTIQPSIYNVSELEIDHSNKKSSLVANTNTLPNNVTVAAGGSGYAVGNFITIVGGTVYPGGSVARLRVEEISGGGATGPVTRVSVVDGGLYSTSPAGVWPIVKGVAMATAVESPGTGTLCTITGTFLGNIDRYEITNIETTTDFGEGVAVGGTTVIPGSFVIGNRYTILTLGGSPNFTAIGAASNTVGVTFTATGIGSGTGTAKVARTVIKLNLNTASGAGLNAPLDNNQIVTIRSLQNFRFTGVERVRPVRPSTALEFTNPDLQGTVYRTLSYQLAYPTGETLQTTRAVNTVSRTGSTATVTTTTPHGLTTGISVNITITTVGGLANTTFNTTTSVPVTFVSPTEFSYLNSGAAVSAGTVAIGSVSYGDQAILTFDNSFDHTIIQTDPTKLTGGYGSAVGDVKIAVVEITSDATKAKLNAGDKVFCWDGRMHVITGYVAAAGPVPAHITIQSSPKAWGAGTIVDPTTDPVATGIRTVFTETRSTILRASLQASSPGEITVNISTCRATGHDFLDIGSGGFNSTNYPNNLLGAPTQTPVRANEAVEETQGRVFYVSTDQFGIFRVGKFFTVDQGTGTVTFAASIALSNLDGIGFKRGTVVKEFSTDSTMTDNSDDTVPVESAIRSYIDKRLGYTHGGAIVPAADRIPALTGGFLSVSNSPQLNADLDMGGGGTNHRIFNLSLTPVSNDEATSKAYVDLQVAASDQLEELKEVNLMTPSAGDIMAFTGAGKHVISTSLSGDIGGTFTSSNTSTLAADYLSGSTASTITIASGAIAGFPSSGFLKIDNEVFQYSGTTTASNRFDGVTRAKFLTVAADHFTGTTVIGLDNSSINLQIQPGVIVNNDVNASAAIDQSKLAMTIATTRASAPAGTAAVIQAASGLASFDSANFEITDGFVGIKAGGVAYAELANIADGKILGNFTGAPTYPREVSTTDIVEDGINSLFTSIDDGAFVMTRRYDSLKNSSSFITITGTAISGSGNFLDIPVSSISGNGSGARVTIGRSGGSYSGVAVTYGGQGYAEGDQLFVSGLLLGGATPANDLSFTVETTGTNIDTVVYLGVQRVSQTAAASSIVKTDASSNLGNSANKFNTVYATTFIGNLTGTVTGSASSATTANNLIGNIVGSIPYQGATDTTTFLSPGTSGRYLRSQGPGQPPIWNEITIPDGDANTLTGTTLASGVVNSSLTSVGTLTSLTVSGNVRYSVDSSVTAIATGTGTVLSKDVNIVVTVPVGGKVQLPVAVAGYKIFIRNNGLNDLTIFPGPGGTINGGAPDDPSAAPIVSGAGLEFICGLGATAGVGGDWYNLDATFA